MDFLGVPDPYKARGHAKTCISAYLSEGIAKPGTGFLSVFSNKNMGGGYGHIWCNAGDDDGTFYESNGVKPLTVTKGKTYSYDSVCNFDSYITGSQPESTNMTHEQFYTKFLESFRKHRDTLEWGDDKFKFEAQGLNDDAMIGRMIDSLVRDKTNKEKELEQVKIKNVELSSQLGNYERKNTELEREIERLSQTQNPEVEAENGYVQAQEILESMQPNGARKTVYTDGGEEIQISYKLKD